MLFDGASITAFMVRPMAASIPGLVVLIGRMSGYSDSLLKWIGGSLFKPHDLGPMRNSSSLRIGLVQNRLASSISLRTASWISLLPMAVARLALALTISLTRTSGYSLWKCSI